MGDVLDKLKGGDRRSIGRANDVVADVLDDPWLFDAVVGGMLHDDPVVRMRAADVAEKVTQVHPEYLQRYKAMLLQEAARIEQQEVRWHVAQMLPRLELSAKERAEAVEILLGYLEDESRIVKTASMQALADLAAGDARLQEQAIPLLEELTRTGSPAMRSRGRKLLAGFRDP
jgi:HEAT repeat protein